MGYDTCFIAEIPSNEKNQNKKQHKIIGAVLVLAIEKDASQLLLHALVIDKAFRGQKLAANILASELLRSTNQQALVCFAEQNLKPFYLGSGFKVMQENELDSHLQQRYQSYKKKKPLLLAFLNEP